MRFVNWVLLQFGGEVWVTCKCCGKSVNIPKLIARLTRREYSAFFVVHKGCQEEFFTRDDHFHCKIDGIYACFPGYTLCEHLVAF